MDNTLVNSLIIELKRGTQMLAVLSQLKTNQYGYSLLQALEEKGVSIEAGTLYPLLRRLESQNLLKSEWDTTESRPRKYYVLSEEGKEIYKELIAAWKTIIKETNGLIEEDIQWNTLSNVIFMQWLSDYQKKWEKKSKKNSQQTSMTCFQKIPQMKRLIKCFINSDIQENLRKTIAGKIAI
ncbi:MAG: PadR family transcriptional regulator [Acholeplasma sp.]|nr:MAG: PadR family transcriptional regulator [Acholeplasma sp.]